VSVVGQEGKERNLEVQVDDKRYLAEKNTGNHSPQIK